MQYKLTKDQFDALSEDIQKEYTLNSDSAVLNIEGDDAPTAEKIATLEKKRDIESEHRKNAENKVREAETRAEKLQKDLENAGGNKDEIQKIKDQHAKEIETMRQERADHDAKIISERNSAMVREEAEKFAAEHFLTPGLISDQVAKRLSVEDVNGQPVVRVINTDGTPSTASIADLQKEFLDNKDYSPIIKANVGKGGGATPGKGGGAATKKLSEMTADEEAAFANDNPEQYAALIQS